MPTRTVASPTWPSSRRHQPPGANARRRAGAGHEDCPHRAGYVIAAMPTLTAIIPATNEPPTLAACLAAIEAADDGAGAGHRRHGRRRPGGGAQRRRRATRRATCSCSSTPTCCPRGRLLAHPPGVRRGRRLAALFGSYDDAPRAPGRRVGLPQPAPPPRPSGGRGPGDDVLGRSRRCARRGLSRRRGFDAERYSVPSIEDIELGTRLVANGGRIVLDPRSRERISSTGPSRPWFGRTSGTRRAVGRALLSRGADVAALNLGWRHRASALARSPSPSSLLRGRTAPVLGGLAALVALNHRSTRCSPAAAARARRRSASAFTRSTT